MTDKRQETRRRVWFWNVKVMARDPWRLALGGPRTLTRRIFCGVCLPQSTYETGWFWNLRVMARDPWRLALGGPRTLARRIVCGVSTTHLNPYQRGICASTLPFFVGTILSSAIYLRDKLVLESEGHGKGPLALGAWRSKNARPTHMLG